MTKRALLIGCNYFTNTSARLNGCIEDIVNVRNMLVNHLGYNPENIVSLRDDDPTMMPTRARILLALNDIIAASGSCSEIWIHYSGHGTQLNDISNDEGDRKDEAIVPCDYTSTGFIIDDVMFDIVKSTKCTTIMFFDSCHSGSVMDLEHSINYVNGSFVKSQSTKKRIENQLVLMMSGCRDEQTSADAFIQTSRKYEGAFTNSLVTTMDSFKYNCDVMKLYNTVCSRLIQGKFTQIPVLSSSVSTPIYTISKAVFVPPVPVVPPVPSAPSAPTVPTIVAPTTVIVAPVPSAPSVPTIVAPTTVVVAPSAPSVPQKPPQKPPTPPRPPARPQSTMPIKLPSKFKLNTAYLTMIFGSGPRPTYTTTKKDVRKGNRGYDFINVNKQTYKVV
jgi:hypothetical protein